MKKGPYFVQPGLGNITEESVVPAKVQHFPGDVGIGPIHPPQGIAGQKPMGPITDHGHGYINFAPFRKKAEIDGGGADL